jgi:hypothetical protein
VPSFGFSNQQQLKGGVLNLAETRPRTSANRASTGVAKTRQGTNRASTGVVEIHQSASRASTGVAEIQEGANRASTGVTRYDEVPTGLLPMWWGIARTAHQPGFYRCGDEITATAPTGLLPVWAGIARILGSGSPNTVSQPAGRTLQYKQKEGTQESFVNRASTGVTAMLRGFMSRLGRTLLNPPAAPPVRTGGAQNEMLTRLLLV